MEGNHSLLLCHKLRICWSLIYSTKNVFSAWIFMESKMRRNVAPRHQTQALHTISWLMFGHCRHYYLHLSRENHEQLIRFTELSKCDAGNWSWCLWTSELRDSRAEETGWEMSPVFLPCRSPGVGTNGSTAVPMTWSMGHLILISPVTKSCHDKSLDRSQWKESWALGSEALFTAYSWSVSLNRISDKSIGKTEIKLSLT